MKRKSSRNRAASRYSINDQESLDLRLDPNASFSSYRVKVSNLTVIDVRNEVSIQSFLNIISEIKPPQWMFGLAKKLKQPEPRTIKTVNELKTFLFDPNFTQWGTLIDQPAASQWFGYYVREAGIHGIIYPSVRHSDGYNVVIFPDSLRDTSARIELIDDAAGVKSEDRYLDGMNARFQMQVSRRESGRRIH
jgi:RES domain